MTGKNVFPLFACIIMAALYGIPICSVHAAPVIRVPSDYPDIQSALDAAAANDTIVVGDGIYDENIVWPQTDNITLTSLNGAEHTFIDGASEQESCIYVGNGQQGVTIDGFTIRNGYGSPPSFHESIRMGGGILIDEDVTATVSGCLIRENGAGEPEYSGGIFISTNSVVSVSHCRIENNDAMGIYFRSGNQAYGSVRNCLIIHNDGGGIYCQESPIVVSGNTIARNTGAGLQLDTPWPQIRNNIIAENIGAAVCSMSPDTAGLLTYNDLWNNTEGDYVAVLLPFYDDMEITGGNGNISADPLFIGGDPFDYRLQPDSPCLGAGEGGSDMGACPDSIFVSGDANNDNRVNALDITKTERIILLLDDETAGADANQDGTVDALDITGIVRIILEIE